jgi:hypothetical protein
MNNRHDILFKVVTSSLSTAWALLANEQASIETGHSV